MLRHLQADRIPFYNLGFDKGYVAAKYNFSSDDVYFGNADKVPWSEISNVDYTGVHNSLPKANFRLIMTIYKTNCNHIGQIQSYPSSILIYSK